MEVKTAVLSDVEEIVKIHNSAFENFFLTSLGDRFLKFYYEAFVNSSLGIVLCAVDGGNILGFAATAKCSKGFNLQLLKTNLCRFFLIALRFLFVSPKSLVRLAKNLTKKTNTIDDNAEYAELYSIGVYNTQQGKGIGKMLLMETENKLLSLGITKISLTTDFNDNDSAINFYTKMGYEVLYEFISYPNRKMYRLIKDLTC